MDETLGTYIGKITHFFSKINVAIVLIEEGLLKKGDTIRIKGHTTDFEQKVASMQIDHKEIAEAKPGDDIGMKMDQPVHEHDKVYKV
ncbi:MAG: EF-Tu/IF-2/RF-3 family GTPase [Nanoarchaeota archaeon]